MRRLGESEPRRVVGRTVPLYHQSGIFKSFTCTTFGARALLGVWAKSLSDLQLTSYWYMYASGSLPHLLNIIIRARKLTAIDRGLATLTYGALAVVLSDVVQDHCAVKQCTHEW